MRPQQRRPSPKRQRSGGRRSCCRCWTIPPSCPRPQSSTGPLVYRIFHPFAEALVFECIGIVGVPPIIWTVSWNCLSPLSPVAAAVICFSSNSVAEGIYTSLTGGRSAPGADLYVPCRSLRTCFSPTVMRHLQCCCSMSEEPSEEEVRARAREHNRAAAEEAAARKERRRQQAARKKERVQQRKEAQVRRSLDLLSDALRPQLLLFPCTTDTPSCLTSYLGGFSGRLFSFTSFSKLGNSLMLPMGP